MANTNTQNKADLRDNLTHLDEKTREMYLRTCSENASHYDPSVFVEALVDEAGTMHLFVPAKKRMAWFKTDYPEGIVAPDPPQYVGRRVTITVRMYNIRLSNPDIWENILKGLSNQLSKKFDQFAEKVEPNYRRGSVVRIKGASAIFLIVSNEKNNLYSGNLTIMPLRIKQESEELLSAHFENQELCAADLSACINIAKGEISQYLGYVGKGFANSIVKEFLQRIKEEG